MHSTRLLATAHRSASSFSSSFTHSAGFSGLPSVSSSKTRLHDPLSSLHSHLHGRAAGPSALRYTRHTCSTCVCGCPCRSNLLWLPGLLVETCRGKADINGGLVSRFFFPSSVPSVRLSFQSVTTWSFLLRSFLLRGRLPDCLSFPAVITFPGNPAYTQK